MTTKQRNGCYEVHHPPAQGEEITYVLIRTAENKYMRVSRAKFNYVVAPELTAVFIRDLDGKVSITNDAEAVVEEIAEHYPNHVFLYKDTNGQWDELMHKGKVFTGFMDIGEEWTEKFKEYLT